MIDRATRVFPFIAIALAGIATLVLVRPVSEVERTRRNFAELQRQRPVAQASAHARVSTRSRIMGLRAQGRTAAGAQRASMEAEASTLESRLVWGDAPVVRAAVLARPLVTLSRTSKPGGLVPVFSTRGSACDACHVAVATSGFEKYPEPFRTHPALASYVGSDSPHPPSRVTCVLCHEGSDHASTFTAAGHSTLRSTVRPDEVAGLQEHGADLSRVVVGTRNWADVGATGAMLPVGRTEAACVTCHGGERYQPGARALNEALVTLDRGGCYACHDVPGMERTPKRGPDLRRIKGKLTPEWVRQWLAEPAAMKSATWMPRFWWDRRVLSTGERAEIDAVIAYLFQNGDDYVPAVPSPPRGDATSGQHLVESVGCLGCHVVGKADRDEMSLRRTFGQPLQAIGSKTTHAWLFDWLRDPSRYSPNTRMPNMRLTPSEAADVAAYLMTLKWDEPLDLGAPPLGDDESYRRIVRRYVALGATAPTNVDRLGGEGLRAAAGRAVIQVRGCFNCHEIRGFERQKTRVALNTTRGWISPSAPTSPAADGGDPSYSFVHHLDHRRSEGPIPEGLIGDFDWARYKTNNDAQVVRPAFAFGPNEAARIDLALAAVSTAARDSRAMSTPWQVTKVAGRTLVQERNCVGCHVIDGVGGDIAGLLGDPSLGPPPLTPESPRAQPEWLRGFMHEPKTIRPRLSVRMPTFGLPDDDVRRVGDYLRAMAIR